MRDKTTLEGLPWELDRFARLSEIKSKLPLIYLIKVKKIGFDGLTEHVDDHCAMCFIFTRNVNF